MKANQDKKYIREMKWMELAMAVAAVILCITLILSITDGDWMDSIANVVYLVVIYEFCKQTRTTRLLMNYIEVLETERDYNEKRIETFEKMCDISEKMICNLKQIDVNNCKIIDNQKRVIKHYERERAEGARFIPSEGE